MSFADPARGGHHQTLWRAGADVVRRAHGQIESKLFLCHIYYKFRANAPDNAGAGVLHPSQGAETAPLPH